jgi:hypothetical protein
MGRSTCAMVALAHLAGALPDMAESKLKNGFRLIGAIFVVTLIVVMILSGGQNGAVAFGALTGLAVGTLIYFIPSFAASYRGHPQLALIFLLNLF